MLPAQSESEFEKESKRTHGRILTGEKRHWCADWDFMPIDETCSEFDACCCYGIGEQFVVKP